MMSAGPSQDAPRAFFRENDYTKQHVGQLTKKRLFTEEWGDSHKALC